MFSIQKIQKYTKKCAGYSKHEILDHFQFIQEKSDMMSDRFFFLC